MTGPMVGDTDALSNAITRFPEAGRRALVAVVAPTSFAGRLTAAQADLLAQVAKLDPDTLLRALIPLAAAYARPAISGFYVGAVARAQSGAIYFGANQEFAGTSPWMTLHAEQSAIAHAWSAEEEAIDTLAVGAAPCGLCRQFMTELGAPDQLRVIIADGPATTLATLLPQAFGPDALDQHGGLLSSRRVSLMLDHATDDALIHAAFAAARRSYAPYTSAEAGIALRLRSGAVVAGAYAESVAHNPSLSPLAAALSHRVFLGLEGDEILAASLVAVGHALIDHHGAARSLLTAVAPGVRLVSWPARHL